MRTDKIRKEVENSPVVMKGDYPYVVFSLICGVPVIDSETFGEAIDAMCEIGDFDCDLIVAFEAMGILYGGPICLRTGVPLVLVRKKSTFPENEVSFKSTTGYSENTFHMQKLERGTRVAIVDDVISTGGTARVLVDVLRDMGAVVTEIVCLINKTKDISALEKEFGVPIRTVATIGFVNGKPCVVD